MMRVQLWRKYLTNTKVSFVENDAECAKKHKAEIEAVAKGKVYVGEPSRLTLPDTACLTNPLLKTLESALPEIC